MTTGISVFKGVQTALATPMLDGEIAWKDMEKLILSQLEQGVDGLVAVGTTGESPTLNDEEHIEVIRRTREIANGRTPVIAGTGSNSTVEAVRLSQQAEAVGADALLLVAPYYNKPNQEGLFLHFSEVAKGTRLPILLYSIPSRCGIEIGVDTVARLHEKFPHVCGIKEAGGSCDRVADLKAALDDDFSIMSGDDALTLPFLSLGAHGVVSVASNLYVEPLRKMVKAAQNNLPEAQEIFQRFAPLFSALFVEPNPVPVKVALAEKGLISSPEVRLPLAPASEATCNLISRVLTALR